MADYIEGKRPIIEALRTQVPIKRILLADNAKRDGLVEDILRKAKHFDVTVTTVPRKTLDDKSERGSHQGVMAETKPHAYVDITEIERAAEVYAEGNGGRALVVILDHLTDAGNLGAIARSAELRVFAWEGSLLDGPAGPQWPEPSETDEEWGEEDQD